VPTLHLHGRRGPVPKRFPIGTRPIPNEDLVKGGSEVEGYPLPFSRLGDDFSRCMPAFSSASQSDPYLRLHTYDMGNCFSSKEKTPPTQRPAPQQQLLPNAPAGHHKIPGAGTPGPADAKLTHFGTVLQRNVETLHGQYTLGRELGRGHFGVTYLCTHVGTKQIFACKSISKKRKIITREDADEVRREVSIMHHLSGHANIVSLKESYEDHDHVHLVMELCSGGELLNHIARDRHYSERKAAKTFRTIMQVIAQAHALGVMHRDLKPENFILADCTPETRLKAADWGSATFFKPGQRFTNIVGQTYYIAPEVLRRSYGKSCDVWSAGVILYILLSGTPPFKADTKEGTFDLIKKGRFNLIGAPWDQISSQAKALLKRLLVVDPKHRITAAEALAHPWLKKAGEAPDTILPDTILSRLKSFGDSNHIKKLALTEIARKVPHHEIEGLHQLFKSFDKDNSGTITREEMRMGLKSMGQQHSEEELEAVMAAADLNGDEQVR